MSLKVIASKILTRSSSDIIDEDSNQLDSAIKCSCIEDFHEFWCHEGHSLLVKAVEAGLVDLTRLLYPYFLKARGPGDKICVQLLKLAILHKHEKVAEILLGLGVYLSADIQHSILLLACGNLEIMTKLIERGVDINKFGYSSDINRYDTCLHVACRKGDLEMMQLLLKYGADANIHHVSLVPPIVDACVYNKVDAIRLLISSGADINHSEGMHFQLHLIPLAVACEHGFVEITRLLLEHGADVNATDFSGDTPLIHTIRCSSSHNLECIQLLLEYGADVSIVNTDGYTALEYVDRNTEIAHMILNSQLECILK